MVNFKDAIQTTVLVVDDDVPQLELRALRMVLSGFSVITAVGPGAAISIMNEPRSRRVDVAVIDYDMPGMNGCILAEYLKARYPQLKVLLYSGAIDIPEDDMNRVDAFIPKSEGLDCLLAKIAEMRQIEPEKSPIFMLQNNAENQVAN
jgi:DNA-binding NtrC family response regulator